MAARIASVTKAAGAVAGPCDATDYRLGRVRMAVEEAVGVGTRTGTWGGATIGFRDKAVDQDACRGAVVALGYRAV